MYRKSVSYIFLAIVFTQANAQNNVGIGTTTPNAQLQLGNTAANRKFVLLESANNDHQFYGLGINTSIFRYQVDATTSSHVFFAGTGASTSNELMRIQGNGNVGIGTSTPRAQLQLGNTAGNRKFVLLESVNNDHQFYGLGINSSTLRYQVDAASSSHVFFAGTSASTSNELMRIQGNGNVGIGTATPNAPLQLANTSGNRKIVLFEGTNNDHQFYGLGINSSILRYQVDATTSNHVFYAGNNASTSTELMRIKGNGDVNIAGYSQLGNISPPIKSVKLIGNIYRRNLVIGNRAEATTNSTSIPVKNIISHTAIVSYSDPTKDWTFSTSGTAGGFGKFSYELIGINSVGVYAVFENCDLCDKNAKLIIYITYTDTPQW